MAIVGYDPHPAGPDAGFVFHRDDGPPLHFMGEQAQQMKQWVDNSRPTDARLAVNAPAPAPANPMQVSFNPAAGVTMAPAPAAVGSDATAAPPAQDGPVLTGPQIAAWAFSKKWVPGRAAYDPTADNASRAPVAVSRTVSGALPGTPEEEKQRLESQTALHNANQAALHEIEAASAERQEAAEARRTQALQNVIESENERRDALAKREQVENVWNSTNARLQKERDAAAEMRADPQRLFTGPAGTYNRVASAIAVGLGAFGAAISKTPNYAQQIVDNAIQRDLDAQTDQIRRRGIAAQNALSDFQKEYGLTLEEARSAVKATQLRYAASLADMNAARIGTADARQNAAVLKANFLQNAAVEEGKLREFYTGRQATNYAMAAPHAATAGGYVDRPISEMKQIAETGGAINKAAGEGQGGIQAQRLQLRKDEDERNRRVALPEGVDVWATTKERADKAKEKLSGGGELLRNLNRMREILSHTGSSLDPEMRAEYDALADRNQSIVKETEGFRTLTESDQEMMKPLTGKHGGDFWTMKDATRKKLQASEQHVNFRMREGLEDLYDDPDAHHHYKKTEEGLGIKMTGKAGNVSKPAPRRRASGADEAGGGEGEGEGEQ